MPWIVLGLLIVTYGYFVNIGSPNFPASIAYAASAFIIAEMIYLAERARDVGMFLGAILGCLPVMIALGLPPIIGMFVGLFGIFAVWFLHDRDFKVGSEREDASALTLVPMVVWLINAVMLIQNLTATMDMVPVQLLVYPVSMILFTAWSVIRFFGIPRDEERSVQISYILVFAAFIGMLVAG